MSRTVSTTAEANLIQDDTNLIEHDIERDHWSMVMSQSRPGISGRWQQRRSPAGRRCGRRLCRLVSRRSPGLMCRAARCSHHLSAHRRCRRGIRTDERRCRPGSPRVPNFRVCAGFEGRRRGLGGLPGDTSRTLSPPATALSKTGRQPIDAGRQRHRSSRWFDPERRTASQRRDDVSGSSTQTRCSALSVGPRSSSRHLRFKVFGLIARDAGLTWWRRAGPMPPGDLGIPIGVPNGSAPLIVGEDGRGLGGSPIS